MNISGAKEKLQKYHFRNTVSFLEWGMLAAIVTFCFFSFHYCDMDSIVDNTVLFVKSIYHGQFLDFYKFSIDNASTSWAANYEIIVYVMFAIWNLPVLIADFFFGVDYLNSPLCIYWSKLMIAFFVAACAWMIYKLCRHIELDKSRSLFGAFLFSSSGLILMFTMVIVQMDIMPIFFMLLGIYMYLRDKKLLFVLCFAIAIPLKMFALFVFIPLVLLAEKNVFKIIAYMIGGFSIQLVHKLIFIGSVEYKYALGSNSNSVINNMMNAAIDFNGKKLPMFIFVFALVCIYCYIKKPSSDAERFHLAFYVPTVIFGSFFTFYSTNTYWIVLLVPFITMVIMQNAKYFKVNLFLEIGITASYIMYCFCYSKTFTLLPSGMDKVFWGKVYDIPSGYQHQFSSIKALVSNYGISHLQNAFFALFVACIIAFLVLNRPGKSEKLGNNEPIDMLVIWARFGLIIVLIAMVMFSYLKLTPAPCIDTTKSKAVAAELNVMKNGNVVTQPISFVEDRSLSSLTLKFDNNAGNRKDMGSIEVSICDENGDKLFSQKIGTSLIKDEKDYTVSLSGVHVSKDEKYEIVISGTPDQRKRGISPMLTEKSVYESPAELNGEKLDSSLYMKVR